MANPSPRLTGLTPSVTFLENTVHSAGLILDPNVTFTHVNNSFNGGELRVTGLASGDLISVRHQGFAAGQIGRSGSEISFGGVVIGAITPSGSQFAVTLNSAATVTAIPDPEPDLLQSERRRAGNPHPQDRR
jgi:hypothetical protein